MARNSKRQPTKVDRALSKLTATELEEWQKLVRFNPGLGEIRDFLNERVHNANITTFNAQSWWQSNKPRGDQAILLNTLSADFKGCEPDDLLNLAAGICAKMLAALEKELDPTKLSPVSKLTNAAELVRELRQCAEAMRQAQSSKTAHDYKEEGAMVIYNHVLDTYKGTPNETALKPVLNDALKRVK